MKKMQVLDVLTNKAMKPKARTQLLADMLLSGELDISELMSLATSANHSQKATCIEAMEYCSKTTPSVVSETCFNFLVKALGDEAPAIKREAARVVGNTAAVYETKLAAAVSGLLLNARHERTVVRWAAAFALTEISKLKIRKSPLSLSVLKELRDFETDNAIRKKYELVLKVESKLS